ncbi:GNAT family N-acetyltransferase [Rossellomorea vietnamensis]|uniref:GNAT family N-acetyltransferase n=1 Tax=Rossellomorea vietnamensis TaxID=218284 RepID=UPI00077C16D0|nr:GNAT family N-acetyltransferase [Rossellomorea vietnamensis]
MEEIRIKSIHPDIRKLLCFATSVEKVEEEYDLYIHSTERKLYGFTSGDELVGCIGVEFLNEGECEIKHIAVMPKHRGKGIGHKMIDYFGHCTRVTAETDRDAVIFYKKLGFKIMSLGEKYPGVERFRCVLERL